MWFVQIDKKDTQAFEFSAQQIPSTYYSLTQSILLHGSM